MQAKGFADAAVKEDAPVATHTPHAWLVFRQLQPSAQPAEHAGRQTPWQSGSSHGWSW